MYGFITRAIFGLEVTEKNGVIRIAGIRADYLIDDIVKVFGTSRVTTNMFNKATRNYVEFYSFFAIDIEYIVRKLAAQKTTRLGKRGYIKMQEALYEQTWLSGLSENHPSIFNKSKLKEVKFDLLKHQAEFIDYYDRVIPKYRLRGILMAATPGSGKTISAIAIACAFEASNVIIVAPKNSVFRVWEKTLQEDMNVPQTSWVHASKKTMPDPSQNRWYIFHYEALGDAISLASKLGSKKCVVVLDESHNLNEMKSLRTERFVSMCKSMSNSIVVELSGTPMKAMGAEAIPLISAIDPMFNDKCVEKFKKIYGREAKAATSILANRLGIIMYKVNKEESKIEEPVEHTLKVKVANAERFTLETIKKDMTAFITQRTEHYASEKKTYDKMYYAALSEFEANGLKKLTKPEQYETYKVYIAEFVKKGYDPFTSAPKASYCNEFEKKIIIPSLSAQSKRDFRSSRAVVKYVNLKIRGECLGTVLSRARTDCNLAVLDALDLAALIDGAEKKTLVFTSYVEIVKATAVKLKEQGYSPLCVYAETNAQLPAMVSQFGKDESINPLIATYQSLSTAVPLIMANRVILLNSPFRIHEKEQTVARANRIGQDRTVDVYNILLDTGDEANISTRSSDIMEWSREQVNAIMGFDNSDNSIALESFQDTECLIDLDIIEDVDIVEEVVGLPDAIATPVEVNEPTISTEALFDKTLNNSNTVTSYIDTVNRGLDNGFLPTALALEMYSLINPPSDTLVMESGSSTMFRTMVSLEQEKNRSSSITSQLLALLLKIYDALMAYIQDADRAIQANLKKCKELKSYLSSSSNKAFSVTKSTVVVPGAAWLTRGNNINAINHMRDLKWQAAADRKTIAIMNQEFSKMASAFSVYLGNIYKSPGHSEINSIRVELNKLTKLLGEFTKNSNDTSVVLSSQPNMGGRQYVLTKPKSNDPASLLKNYGLFKLKHIQVANFNIDSDKPVESLNRSQANDVIDVVIDINRNMSYVTGFIRELTQGVKNFIRLTTEYNKKLSPEMDSAHVSLINAQVSLMSTGLKSAATYTKEFVRISDRTSKASLQYVIKSASGHISDET